MEHFEADDDVNVAVPDELRERAAAARDSYLDVMREVRAARLAALTEEPKCPEGCGGVLRQKCMWDYGPGCPRFDVCNAYGGDHRIRKHLEGLKGVK